MDENKNKTVADLIEYLKTLPQEAIVILSADSEGNGFSPWCGDHAEGRYVEESTYSGEFHSDEFLEEAIQEGWEIEGERAVVLWPIN